MRNQYIVTWFVTDSDGDHVRQKEPEIHWASTPMEAIERTVYGYRRETLCGKIWWQVIEVKHDGHVLFEERDRITIYEGTQEYIEMEYTDTLPNVWEDGEV